MKTNRIQQFSIFFAFIMISWAMLPFFGLATFNETSIATSIILILIGIAYPLAVIKPQWNKSLLFFEGLIIATLGFIFLEPLGSPLLLIIGVALAILSVLAYMRKLPNGLLKFFYKAPK